MNVSELLYPTLLQLATFSNFFIDAPISSSSGDHTHFSAKKAYDPTAHIECQKVPSSPLYSGGVLHNPTFDKGLQGWEPFGGGSLTIQTRDDNYFIVASNRSASYQGPSQKIGHIREGLFYAISAWVQINGTKNSSLVKATMKMNDNTYQTLGSVLAKKDCWSFVKGGFTPESNFSMGVLYFETSDPTIDIMLDSVSVQPFTQKEWWHHQQVTINEARKQSISIQVKDCNGSVIPNITIKVEQTKMSFPFGSAIASNILENPKYQKWYLDRFNTAVFENELKWYSNEPQQGKVTYDVSDKMFDFCNKNGIIVRGHNIFWEDPNYQPNWVKGLTGVALKNATNQRLQSVLQHYTNKISQWDVANEMLHFSYFDDQLGKNTSLNFYIDAQQQDPSLTLFMNDYNVIEEMNDIKSTPDLYIERLHQLYEAGVVQLGIGLESHFTQKPNLVYMRAVLDKLGTLDIPIWLTEVDINNNIDKKTQAKYLQLILREAFSHPAVSGIMLWSALHSSGCYRMCLTDNNFNNLPTGEVVDAFIHDIKTTTTGTTNANGTFTFAGFLGAYNVIAAYNQTTIIKTIDLDGNIEAFNFLAG